MTPAPSLADEAREVGGRTLEIFANTPNINAWMYSKFAPLVHGTVLEVGSGMGNLSRLIRKDADRLVLTELEPAYLDELRATFARDRSVEVVRWDLGEDPPSTVANTTFDAIVAINVIEHIEDDHRAVRALAERLRPGGHLLAYVPAGPLLYGTLDEALGHHRRYTRASFAALLRSAGLDPGVVRHMNLLGMAGWFVQGRVLRRRQLPARQVAVFERLVPLLRVEDRFALPFGLGVLACARKPIA